MEENMLTTLSATDILEKEFRTELRGYSVNEVDDFLDEIISDYTKMYNEIDKLNNENANLKRQLKDNGHDSKANINSKSLNSNLSSTSYDLLKRVNLLEKQVVEIMKHLRKKN